jgi:hypothetical protein
MKIVQSKNRYRRSEPDTEMAVLKFKVLGGLGGRFILTLINDDLTAEETTLHGVAPACPVFRLAATGWSVSELFGHWNS